MSNWLQFRCGEFPLLLPAEAVLDIARNQGGDDAAGRRVWRASSLPVVDMPARLGCSGGEHAIAIVVGDAQSAHALCVVDDVIGMREIDEAGITPVDDFNETLAGWFAGVSPDVQGRCLLCLRFPFVWLDEGACSAGRNP